MKRADESEAAACLALIPEAQGLPAILAIARRGGELAGAAALCWRSWQEPSGFPASIHVLPSHRRRRVGRALFTWCTDRIRGEAGGLWTFAPVPLTGPRAGFCDALGLRPEKTVRHFTGGIAALLANLAPVAERRRSRGHAGSAFAFAPLGEQNAEDVGWLVSAEFGGGPISALHRLRRRAANGPPAGPDRSFVAMADGRIAGVVMWRIEEGAAVIDAQVVARRWRRSALNLLMMEEGLKRGLAENLSEIRFFCEAGNSDTLGLARRCGAAEAPPTALWFYAA
ncbi:MAG: GNAT family N-acetyltransferase [Caulobacteraceae bacterium]